MSGWWGKRGLAFSLLEMVLVMAIIAILAAVAIPRVGRRARGATESSLAASLAALRGAIDRYAAEHGGNFPQWNLFAEQLTTYTNGEGQARAGRDAAHPWGPYLLVIPRLPVGANKGRTGARQVDGAGVGWIYDQTAGTIQANCADTELDEADKRYKDY